MFALFEPILLEIICSMIWQGKCCAPPPSKNIVEINILIHNYIWDGPTSKISNKHYPT